MSKSKLYIFEKETLIKEVSLEGFKTIRKMKEYADATIKMMTSPILEGICHIPDLNCTKSIIKVDDDTVYEKDHWMKFPKWKLC